MYIINSTGIYSTIWIKRIGTDNEQIFFYLWVITEIDTLTAECRIRYLQQSRKEQPTPTLYQKNKTVLIYRPLTSASIWYKNGHTMGVHYLPDCRALPRILRSAGDRLGTCCGRRQHNNEREDGPCPTKSKYWNDSTALRISTDDDLPL